MIKYKLKQVYPGSSELGVIHWYDYGEKSSSEWLGTKVYESYPEFWEKLEEKKVLIKTEDGVDVFEDSKVYWVRLYREIGYLYELSFCEGHLVLDFENEYKIFSTKELADEYVKDMNILLTTEDGVALRRGDSFWHVDPYWSVMKGLISSDEFTALKGYKMFSTKELAKQYVTLNEPMYSLQNILDAQELPSTYAELFFTNAHKFINISTLQNGRN